MKPEFKEYHPGSLPILNLYSHPVRAGFPSPADDFIDKRLDLNEHLIKHPAATFFFRMGSSAMRKSGIFAGDLLIVDRSLDPYHEAIVVAVLEGNFLVRRYCKSRNGVSLVSDNSYEEPITVTKERQFEVWGVVTSVIHKVTTSQP